MLLSDFSDSVLLPNCSDPYPPIRLLPNFTDCSGFLLGPGGASMEEASGKTVYQLMVKTLNRRTLNGCTDTPWRTSLTKTYGDLQWRILHGIIVVNAFISVINAAVE